MIVLVALVVVAVGAIAIFLPRIAERPEVRERIVNEARAATGRELSYEGIGIGLLPPRFEMQGPVLAGIEGEASISAERIGLRIAWLPLLVRKIVIESIDVEGPSLQVLRTSDGFVLPFSPQEEEEEEIPEPDAPREETPRSEGFELLLRGVRIADATVTIEDRTLEPPASLTIRELSATLKGASLSTAVDFEMAAEVAETGRLAIQGHRASGGAMQLRLQLEALALDTLEPWVGDDDFAGNLELDVTAELQRDVFDNLEVKARLTEATLEFGDVLVRGVLPVLATLAGPADRLAGPVELDLTDVELSIDDTFHKPRGVSGRLAGHLIQEGDARTLQELDIELHNLKATGKASLGERTELQLNAEAFGLAGWEKLLPALGDQPLLGTLQLDDLAVGFGPLSVRGEFLVAGFEYPLKDGKRLKLSGRLRGTGDAIEGEALDLRVADQPFQLALRLHDLSGSPAFTGRLDTDDADSQMLWAAFAGKKGSLSGPLRLRSEWAGALSGAGELIERVTGKLRFDIAPGRLEGVSLLEQTFKSLRSKGGALVAASRLAAGDKTDEYYGDEFERLGGSLNVRNGIASTRDLRLDYRDYQVDLRGTVGVVSRQLDLTGKLTIFEELDEVLAPEDGGESNAPRKRVIPLAAVTGTIDDPKVTVTRDAARAFGSAYIADDRRRKKWERKIDERLGEGSGKDVLKLLDSILNDEPLPEEPEAP
ncbi:MAG: AsmA family protein [bacterium]|nr:AsmA family protein [bacterium]